jgi:hypothetical protein
LERVLRRVVVRSFPELRRLRIGIACEELDPGTLLQYYVVDGRWRIAVSPEMRRAPARVLEGGIAHELAHIVRDCRLGPFQRDLAFDRFAASRTYRIKEERATDRRAVERGYGPQLLALVKWARTVGIRFYGDSGLRAWEIALPRPPGSTESQR